MKKQQDLTVGIVISTIGLMFMLWHLCALFLGLIGLVFSICCFTMIVGLPILGLSAWMYSAISGIVAFGIGIPLFVLGIIIECISKSD